MVVTGTEELEEKEAGVLVVGNDDVVVGAAVVAAELEGDVVVGTGVVLVVETEMEVEGGWLCKDVLVEAAVVAADETADVAAVADVETELDAMAELEGECVEGEVLLILGDDVIIVDNVAKVEETGLVELAEVTAGAIGLVVALLAKVVGRVVG